MSERRFRTSPVVLLAVLTGLNALNYLDRYVAAATLPLLLKDLSASDAAGGLLQSAFILSYSLVCPIAGWLGDRVRRLRLCASGVFVWSAATAASAFAPTWGWLLAARTVIGAGEASYSVVTPSLLSDRFAPGRRGRALAIFYAAIPIGSALGYAVGGAVGASHGWRAAFLVAGIPGALLAASLLFLGEPERGALDGVVEAPVPLDPVASLRALAARRSWLWNTAAQVLYTFAMGGLATWMPTFLVRERGVPLATASTAFGGILVAAGFLGTLIGGRLSLHTERRKRGGDFSIGGVSLVASLPFSILSLSAPDPRIFWPATFVTLLLLFVNVGPLNAALADVLPSELRSRGFAVTTMVMHLLGDAASPWLIGAASDRIGLRIPVLATGCLISLSGVVLLFGRKALVRDLAAREARA